MCLEQCLAHSIIFLSVCLGDEESALTGFRVPLKARNQEIQTKCNYYEKCGNLCNFPMFDSDSPQQDL